MLKNILFIATLLAAAATAWAQLPLDAARRPSPTAKQMPVRPAGDLLELKPAVMAAPATQGIITSQPEGTLSTNLYGTSKAYYLQYGYVISDKSDGTVGRIVVNGDKMYLYQPFSLFPSATWVMGTIEGDTVTFKPQPVFNYTSSTGVNTTYYLRRISYTEGATGYTVPDDSADVKFLYKDGTLRMATDGVMAMVDGNKSWSGFGDAEVEFTPIDDKTVSLPAGLSPKPYTMYYSVTDSTGEVQKMDVAVDGDTYYLGHLVPSMGQNWIKGTRQGNTVALDLPQYLGPDTVYNYHCYAFAGSMAYEYFDLLGMWLPTPKLSSYPYALTLDEKTGTLRSDSLLILNMGKNQVFYLTLVNRPVFKPFNAGPGKPKAPFFTKYDPYQERYGNGYIQLACDLTTEAGDYMDPEQLYYRLYIDDKLYEFTPSLYTRLKENTTEIPYNYDDDRDFEVRDDGSRRIFFYDNTDRIAIQTVYKGGGETRYSDIVPLRNFLTGVASPVAGDKAQTVVATRYYDLAGRLLAAPAQGIVIKVETLLDGTRRVSKLRH